ncbi:MAG: DUF393 domain-containing protein [Pseudomonadota bacterium]
MAATDPTATPQRTQRTVDDGAAAATVYYDGACPVCSREIATYRGMQGGGEIAWIDVADPASADRLPPGTDRDRLLARFTVETRDGRQIDGARGFAALWRALPRMRRLGRLLDSPPVAAVAELGYRGFLALRPLWRRG